MSALNNPPQIPTVKKSRFEGKKLVCFGDSITDRGNYPSVIATLSGMTVYNIGFGGTRLARHSVAEFDPFSMSKLADAIVSGVWTTQEANAASADLNNRLPTLEGIDFSSVDYVTIFYGTNDWSGGIALGTDTDTTDVTFKGAINHVVATLQGEYPQLKIMLISPMWRARLNAGDGLESDANPNGYSVYLKEYVDAMVEAARVNHLPVVDMYRNNGINKYTELQYLNDGLHCTDAGYELLGNIIFGKLQSAY